MKGKWWCGILLFWVYSGIFAQTNVSKLEVFSGFSWAPGEVVEIKAQSMQIFFEQNRARFLGKVIIKKGDSIIYCDELELGYSEQGEIKWLVARRGVKLVEGKILASGEELEYKSSEQKFWLRGGPRLVRSGQIILGREMIFDLKTKKLEVTSPQIQFKR